MARSTYLQKGQKLRKILRALVEDWLDEIGHLRIEQLKEKDLGMYRTRLV